MNEHSDSELLAAVASLELMKQRGVCVVEQVADSECEYGQMNFLLCPPCLSHTHAQFPNAFFAVGYV